MCPKSNIVLFRLIGDLRVPYMSKKCQDIVSRQTREGK